MGNTKSAAQADNTASCIYKLSDDEENQIKKHNSLYANGGSCSCGKGLYEMLTIRFFKPDKKIIIDIAEKIHCDICHLDYRAYKNARSSKSLPDLLNKLLNRQHCCECKLEYLENEKHCCKCKKTFSNNYVHCDKCCIITSDSSCADCFHCCKCKKTYSYWQKHCEKCCTTYKVNDHFSESGNKHCEICCATYDAFNTRHCFDCCITYDYDSKHCCKCECVYDKASHHCCKCNVVWLSSHSCKNRSAKLT